MLLGRGGTAEQHLQEDGHLEQTGGLDSSNDGQSISSSVMRMALPDGLDDFEDSPRNDLEQESLKSEFEVVPATSTMVNQQLPPFAGNEIAKSDLERACSEAHLENGMVVDLKQPWEKDVFAVIFNCDENVFPRVERPEGFYEACESSSTHLASSSELLSKPTFFESCVSFHMCKTKLYKKEEQLDLVIQRWEAAIMLVPMASSTGRYIFGKEKAERVSTVADILGGKSVSTLRKRSSQLKYFLDWGMRLRDQWNTLPRMPLSVRDLRDYCKHLKNQKCALSKIRGWMECSTFMHHVLGVQVEEGYFKDVYIAGVLRGLNAKKPRRKQSRCFKVEEIKSLEAFLADPCKASVDRYAMGCVLFAIYSRARFADLFDIEEFIPDVIETPNGWRGYLELRSASHKLRSVGDGLGLSLPLIAPVRGLGDGEWGMKFIEVSNLVSLDIKMRIRGPLLPAPDKLGNWTDRSISTREVGKWFRSVLVSMGHDDLDTLTPHGAKSTTLAQMAKFGVPEADRLVLGHHKSKAGSSLDVYARDSQAAPLRKLEGMLDAIRAGVFHPDLTRSGMVQEGDPQGASRFEAPGTPETVGFVFPKKSGITEEGTSGREVPQEFPDLMEENAELENEEVASENQHGGFSGESERKEDSLADSPSESDSDSSSDSSSSSVDDEVLGKSDDAEGLQGTWRDDCRVVQHKRLKTLHLLPNLDNKGTFVCGRAMSGDYKLFEAKVFSDAWKCKQCKGGRPIRSVEAVTAALDRALKKRKI